MKLVAFLGIYSGGRKYISLYPILIKKAAKPRITAQRKQIVELASLSLFFTKSKTIFLVKIICDKA